MRPVSALSAPVQWAGVLSYGPIKHFKNTLASPSAQGEILCPFDGSVLSVLFVVIRPGKSRILIFRSGSDDL